MITVLMATAVAAWAQYTYTMSAQQLVSFIQSSLRLHQDDGKVATFVKKTKLTDRLEDRKVEELQGMGVGPRTMQALRVLSTSSKSMAVAPPPVVMARPVIPPPEPEELKRILNEIIDNARTYSKTLPDYLCVEVTRKHFDPSGTENWRQLATVQEQVSYVDHKEAYNVTMINGRAVTNVGHESVGGSTLSAISGASFPRFSRRRRPPSSTGTTGPRCAGAGITYSHSTCRSRGRNSPFTTAKRGAPSRPGITD